jgi:hypothetical protein
MLADSKGKVVVSNLGWVDRGNLWVMETGRGQADTLALSEAKYVSLHPGNNDYFSVNHRFDGAQAKITVHLWSAEIPHGLHKRVRRCEYGMIGTCWAPLPSSCECYPT